MAKPEAYHPTDEDLSVGTPVEMVELLPLSDCMRGIVEIESERTASERGWQLREWMRYRQFGASSPVPKS